MSHLACYGLSIIALGRRWILQGSLPRGEMGIWLWVGLGIVGELEEGWEWLFGHEELRRGELEAQRNGAQNELRQFS
jgi:hypothetical protein